MTFYSIQKIFTGNILVKFGIPNLPQSPDIRLKSDEGISVFLISGQSLGQKNSDNSRTSNDIDMKLGPVTKNDKGKTATFKKTDQNLTMTLCRPNVTSLSYF